MPNFKVLSVVLILLGVVSGCSSSNSNQDLKDFIAENKRRPPGRVEAAPKLQAYDAFIYDAYRLRGPFDRPVTAELQQLITSSSNVKPDFSRPKERLEQFDLASLAMVGTLQKNGLMWALVRDPDGSIERIQPGNYMGSNHGQITNLSESSIELIEIVSSGEGWLERPNILELKPSEGN
ncbi:MAG: type IV pilus assembly protein PilP [Pseudohongiellaceae bacterium]|jgi:type IV pilus assembly protein PilP